MSGGLRSIGDTALAAARCSQPSLATSSQTMVLVTVREKGGLSKTLGEETPARCAASSGDRAMTSVVVVLRHGERQDYVMRDRGENWIAEANKDDGSGRPWDPPLSPHGHEQASKAGSRIAAEVQRLGLPPIRAVCSSPFLRCRQTSAAARRAMNSINNNSNTVPPVKIEYGLAESVNESWYRSWALPETDGTWGYRMKDRNVDASILTEPSRLHPASVNPVQTLLDWKATVPGGHADGDFDFSHESVTRIDRPYCLHPRLLESRKDQRKRMMDSVETLKETGGTVVLVSHGGPVTHLYEELTGENWDVHGPSTYCCYSVYQLVSDGDDSTSNGGDGARTRWKALVVNESNYLHEKLVGERHVS